MPHDGAVSCLSSSGLQTHSAMPGFSRVCQGSKLKSPCMYSTFLTKQFPQPHMSNCKGYAKLQNYEILIKTSFLTGFL